MGGFAWVTLATNDSYSLGALVLAHSLRRAGTPHDLIALVTPGVSQTMRNQLSTIFTSVQEVNVLDSKDEANLALLERPDLGITFTKLHCWRLTQYEKCVFLDADTLVLKNSDELFEREELSAAPDPGWPDCFNSGVFVYRPSQDTFNAIIKFALTKGSFDGGDQGLLNMFFSDWATKDIRKHLPFIYNMVSTATYSYLPAYKQFGESAKIVHFIGANKPWLQYFDSETKVARSPTGSEHMQPLLQLWWDIFCSTVHPSLSPDMADRTTFEQPAHTATPTVSHFIIDLLQKFQPMSIYSEHQPISITPYAEDPSLGFWDPWENYIEHAHDSSHNEHHISPWEYHGSDQQKKAFIHDDRQSGWKRHEEIQHEPQHHVHHHHQQHHVEHHHQEPQHHHYHEPQHHQQHHENHHHHHHHEPQPHHHQPQHHHHHEHHHQQQHHEPKHQQHYELYHHHEPHHHHHEPHHQHHEPHHQHHEPHHQHHEPHHQHHEPHHQHHEPHHQHHEPHHQHHEPHHHYQYHEPQPQHNQHHEHHHHHEHQHHEHQQDHHQHHHDSQHHEQPPQHHNNKPHEEYQIYNVPPPPWESHNEHEHRDESHGHNHHPDPSSTSQANNNINSQYVKVANETEYSVDEPSMEDDPSRTTDDGLGLAGALAQLTLGVPRSAEQTAFEEHMRRQAWEQGNMDYMGRDSFDNIWRKITETLAEAPTKPATEEVPPTQPASEPKLPESKPPAPKSRKSPPADTNEVPGLSSSVEPTTNQTSQVTETPLDSKSIEPSPLTSSDISPPKIASEQAKPIPLAPHTPSIIEATPPTSPPIVIPSAPLADIQALKVEATPPETPPVGSSLSEQLKTTQTTESHEQTLPISKDSNIQQSSPAPECPSKEPSPAEKKEPSDTLEQVETFSQEVPALKEITSSLVSTPTEVPASSLEKETPVVSSVSQIPSTQETSVLGDVPLPKDEVTVKTTEQTDSSISPPVHKTEIFISQSTDATIVPSPDVLEVKLPAEQVVPISQPTDEVKVPSLGTADTQPAVDKDVPVKQISSATTEIKPVLDVTVSQQVVEPQIPTQVKSPADNNVVSQKIVEPLIPASPLPEVKPTIEKGVPVAQQVETSTSPSSVTEVPAEEVIPDSQQIAPTSNVTQVKSSVEEVVKIPQQVTDPLIPASAVMEVKPSEKEVSVSPSAEKGPSPVSPPTSNNETQVSKSQSNEKSVPEESNTQTAPAPVVKTGKKSSVELKTTSVESTQPAQVPKSPPSKSSAPVSTPSTPDVPPSDQAPVPPKRRGHKSGGTAAASEQGAASKPAAQPQAQQSKGSKGQKGKK